MAIYDIVVDRFGLSEEYASTSLTNTETYMNDLEVLLNSFVPPDTSDLENVEIADILPLDFSTFPDFTAVLDEFPTFDNILPAVPELETPGDPNADIIPERSFNFNSNSLTAPTLTSYTKPTAPSITSVSVDDMDSYIIPDTPDITPIVIPGLDDFDIPIFDAETPVLSLPDSPVNMSYVANVYNSEISASLFAKILRDIQEGGTGLDTYVETELYERARERQAIENEALYTKIMDHYGATGFNFPTGIIGAKLSEVLYEMSRKDDQMSREVLISQAELAQKNTHFTVEQAGVLEKLLRDFYNQQENRAYEYAKSIATIGMEIANHLLEKQKLRFSTFGIYAEAFKAKVEAAKVHVDIYLGKMQGAKIASDIQETQMRIYQIETGVIEILAKIYTAKVEGAKVKQQIESLKVELFKAQTDAYVAGLTANRVKAEVYASEVEAEKSRAMAFGEVVKAYATEVSAKRNKLDAEIAIADLVIRKNAQLVDKYRAELENYRAELETELKNAELTLDAYKTGVQVHDLKVKAKVVEFETRIKETETQLRRATLVLDQQKALLETTVQSYTALKSLQEKGTEGIMNVNAQLAASAMNAVNASAGISGSTSTTDSTSTSDSTSVSESTITYL